MATHSVSFCGNLACGGWGSRQSCFRFDGAGTFTALSVTLREERAFHLCWKLQSGEVLLLGGWYSGSTTERLTADGSSSTADFNLPYSIEFVSNPIIQNDWHCLCRDACGIDLNGIFIVTGGYDRAADDDTRNDVVAWAEKSSGGFQAVPYPELQEGRYYHACSHFVDNNGETVSFNQK